LTGPYDDLLTTFRNQAAFSREYSALYTSLFTCVAAWLAQDRHGPAAAAILRASIGRRPLDVTLLFAAALHRDVLLGEPTLAELAAFYPSVGGTRSPGYAGQDDWRVDPGFRGALHRAVLARRRHLRHFIRSYQVQTNETGRGIAWLFPLWLARWPRVNLLDLGASAGLNLVADLRRYRFHSVGEEEILFELGRGQRDQFTVQSPEVRFGRSRKHQSSYGRLPRIISRTGADLNPFHLNTPIDEATLAAYIWADQPVRLRRLREGIAALRQVNNTGAPVQLHDLELPAGLPDFLARHAAGGPDPLVCYNTYIRMYLPDKGADLRRHLSTWAARQDRPIVWIQWEPPSLVDPRSAKAPEFGWLAWTVDLWYRGEEIHWHIAWVHPHGHNVHWLPDLSSWTKKARSLCP
jgi:hypothetical protein